VGRYTANPASWITVTSAFSVVLRGSRKGGKYETPAQLRDPQLERAEACVEAALAIAVAIVERISKCSCRPAPIGPLLPSRFVRHEIGP
jgi:hypothetical protein